MNIDCDIILTNLDNILDDYNGHIQKIMILQVIQQIFVKYYLEKKNVNSDDIFYSRFLLCSSILLCMLTQCIFFFNHSNQCVTYTGF